MKKEERGRERGEEGGAGKSREALELQGSKKLSNSFYFLTSVEIETPK